MSEPVVVPSARDVRGSLDAPGDGDSDASGDGDSDASGDGDSDASGGGDSDASGDGHTDASAGSDESDVAACVVACPPHPQLGGSRSDRRLRAVSEALVERGIACLRIDYGPWDAGRGERRDATDAFDWASERFERVGAFGYSFGATVALVAAARSDGVDAVSALAPATRIGHGPESGDPRSDADRHGVDADRHGVDADRHSSDANSDRGVDAVAALDDLSPPVQVVVGQRDDTVDWEPVVDRARERGSAVETVPADHHFVGQAEAVASLVSTFLAGALG